MPSGVYDRTKKGGMKGKHHTEESKKKMSISQKGLNIWTKGKRFSEEVKRKISEAHKGKHPSEETRKKMSLSHIGLKHTQETRDKLREIGKNKFGADVPNWRGDNVGYSGLHYWVIYHLGQPTKCEHCGKDGLTGIKIHWANRDHSYKRNLTDWIRLCSKCHKEYDKTLAKI